MEAAITGALLETGNQKLETVFSVQHFVPDPPLRAFDLNPDLFRKPALSQMAEGEMNALEGFSETETPRNRYHYPHRQVRNVLGAAV
jgi:hypothetical protein